VTAPSSSYLPEGRNNVAGPRQNNVAHIVAENDRSDTDLIQQIFADLDNILIALKDSKSHMEILTEVLSDW